MEKIVGMHTRDMQEDMDAWISQFEEGYFDEFVQMSRMMEELGELSRALSYYRGVKKLKEGEVESSVEEELGDLVVVMVCFANGLGIDLGEAYRKSFDKIKGRDVNRWTRKKS